MGESLIITSVLDELIEAESKLSQKRQEDYSNRYIETEARRRKVASTIMLAERLFTDSFGIEIDPAKCLAAAQAFHDACSAFALATVPTTEAVSA